MTASHLTPMGAPVRATMDGTTRTGEFGGVIDRTYGRVRIGHRVRTVALSDIEVITAPVLGDRWAALHRGSH